MKKGKLFFIFIFLNLFLIPNVKAYTDITSLPSNVSNTCDRYNCWSYYNSYKAMRGMRVSLMKTDGTQVGKTYNMIADYKHYELLVDYGNYIVLGENCNKVQYEMGKCTAEVERTKNWDDSPWKWSDGYLGSAENIPYFSYFNVPLQSYLLDWKIDEIWEWADTDKLPLTDSRVQGLYNLLFGLSSQELNDIAKDQDLLNDLWIVVEPLTMLRYNGINYLGTNYELSRLGYGNMLNTNIGSVVGRMMPCSAMTTGDIIQKYPNAPGVSGQSYFNNNLYFVNPSTDTPSDKGSYTINQICSTSSNRKFKNWYVNSNQGVGIGLIYFKDTIKNNLTCEDVDSGISNYDSFMNKIDNAYKNGGLNAIYALPEVANGIKYTYNGQQKIADKTWYINECTCYGAYDTYKGATGTELYTLPKTSIQTIFNDQKTLFTNYTTTLKNQIKTIADSKPETVGTIGDWDYNKYIELNCEYNATNSCEAVDFDKLSKYDSPSYYECNRICNDWIWHTLRECNNCWFDYNNNNRKNDLIEDCKNLPLYKDSNYTNSYINSNQNLYSKCFQIYNSQKNTNWTLSSYKSQGCSPDNNQPENKKYNCTPKYNVGTCIDQENVYYNDNSSELSEEDYWNYCVFSDDQSYYDIDKHKWSDSSKDPTYFDSNISSPYCEVYCIETLSGAFNSETITVKAGQHFVWNGHSVSGSRTCRTKSVEWDKFREDLKEMNNKIEKAFNTYLVARDQQASITKYENEDKCKSCTKREPSYPCGCDKDGKNCTRTCLGDCISYKYWDETCIKWDSASYGDGDVAASGASGSDCSCSNYPTKDFDADGKYEDYEDIMNDSKEIYNNMLKCYNADKSSSWVGTTDDNQGSSWDQWLYNDQTVQPYAEVHYNYKIGNSYGDYKVDEILRPKVKFTDTTNINDCKPYDGGVEVLLNCYEKETKNISCDKFGNCALEDDKIDFCELDCDSSTCTLKCSYDDYNCIIKNSEENGDVDLSCTNSASDSCVRKNLSINKCTKVHMSKGANVRFEYPDEIYAFIEKENNTSFNASQLETIKSSYQNKTFNYIYLGYSNFPVQYSTPDGIYGKAYDNGELSITYKNLGYKLPDKNTTAVDTILSAIDSAKYGEWQCQFEVYSELIPDPDNPSSGGGDPSSPKKGDIELIYRPIDLYDPFPDIDASGRNTGSNWCYGGLERVDCSNTNQTVEEVILDNRGVEGHDIYYEEPMYTFILTPSIIKEIRNYNFANILDENGEYDVDGGYVSYTGTYGGKVYDFKCNEGTGRTCISDYLTYLIDITGAKNQPGTCVDDKYRSYNDPDNFDACRY